ncbi:hypothetical protein [Yeosuana sp.]|uniref:hypothetical protein n=1 Tax=Yeosuana sp. TaxID=2529388 RepID=UPI004054DC79
MLKPKLLISFLLILILIFSANSQEKEKDTTKLESALSGFKFRSIGPAFMSGRVADIVIDPNNQNIWYVAEGSSGVWKTTNSGTTWNCLTDKESFFSTGCITLDPNNTNVSMVGHWRKRGR